MLLADDGVLDDFPRTAAGSRLRVSPCASEKARLGEDVDDRVLGSLTVHGGGPGQVPAYAGMTELRRTRRVLASWVITGRSVVGGGHPIRQDSPFPFRSPYFTVQYVSVLEVD